MPAQSLRRALESYRRAEARARVGRWRGEPSAQSEADVLRDHAWLAAEQGLERLREAVEAGALARVEATALRAHLADLHAERELASTRAAWRALPSRVLERDGRRARCADLVERVSAPLAGVDHAQRAAAVRALEGVAAEIAPRVEETLQRASAARRSALGDAVEDHTATLTLARDWLAGSEDLARDLVARAASSERMAPPERWEELAALACFDGQRGRFGPRDRVRRVGALFTDLGFARELGAVRIEPEHASLGVRAHLAVLDPTRDVRVSPAAHELGMASELALVEGVGRALGQLLVPAALPFAQRVPVADDAARTLAALMLQVPFDPAASLGGRELARERPARGAAGVGLQLVALRVSAASLVARAEGSRDAIEALAARALGVSMPFPLARLALLGQRSPLARFRAGLRALVFWPALREALDEDWFRNPRSAEVLRASVALWAGGHHADVQLPGIWERALEPSDVESALERARELAG